MDFHALAARAGRRSRRDARLVIRNDNADFISIGGEGDIKGPVVDLFEHDTYTATWTVVLPDRSVCRRFISIHCDSCDEHASLTFAFLAKHTLRWIAVRTHFSRLRWFIRRKAEFFTHYEPEEDEDD